MCLDTLGQDRIFNDEEIKYIKIVGANIRDSLEKLEQSLLEKDRDIRIKFLDNEAKLKTEEKYSDEKFEECVNNYISQFYTSEEYKSKGITDEDAKSFEGDLQKLKYLKNILLEGDCQNILLTFQEFEFVEYLKIFQNLFYFAKMNPLDINELNTNKLEWKKARKFWKDLFPYIKQYNPVGPKPEEVKQIYKLNKIKENLESCLTKRDEIKTYSQTLLMLIDLIFHIIRVRHDNIIDRICKIAVYKDKREQIIKNNKEIDEERQKIIDAAKAQNPNVKIPGENDNKEENKEGEEEKKEGEENKEGSKENENKENPKETEKKENKEENKDKENKENKQEGEQGENKEGEQKENEENNKDELDSAKLAEDLQKFDEEHPKQEVPPDMDYDIDNDYDIDPAEREMVVNNALQAANSANNADKEKKQNPAPATGANVQPNTPTSGAKANNPPA
jgi:DNA polymerase III gamma/tau subunit